MDPVSRTSDRGADHAVDFVRRRRSELRGAMSALERALASPAPGRTDDWAERVRAALVDLSEEFQAHVDVNESPDGLHRAVVGTAPRLANAVARLAREHVRLNAMIDDLLGRVRDLPGEPDPEAGVDAIRERGTSLLARLIRHRQRSADLVFEAYQVDIGGEA
jgi:hypothetical protein